MVTHGWDALRHVPHESNECAIAFSINRGRGASRPCVTTRSVGTRRFGWFLLFIQALSEQRRGRGWCYYRGASREFKATRRNRRRSLTSTRFGAHCYAAAREAGWSVREVLTPRQPIACNYALAVFTRHDLTIAAALNGVFPLLAFAIPPTEGQVVLDFADCPELGIAFEQFGYKVLPAVELARPLTHEMWQGLAPHERKDVRYFRPERVGDVIYNYWD